MLTQTMMSGLAEALRRTQWLSMNSATQSLPYCGVQDGARASALHGQDGHEGAEVRGGPDHDQELCQPAAWPRI